MYVLIPKTTTQLHHSLCFVRHTALPYFSLGGGTNTLIGSTYFPGIVLFTKDLKNIARTPTGLHVEAGATNSHVACEAYKHGLHGAEFLYGMPGTIGGTTVMNARCYDGEISRIVSHVNTVDPDGNRQKIQNKDLEFSYKHSCIQSNGHHILSIDLTLDPGNKEISKEKMKHHIKDRTKKNQFSFPSAGCIFKNNYDIGIPTGKLIEDHNLKNLRVGHAAILPAHGNFIINTGQATSSHILNLAQEIKNHIHTKTNINLEYEIQLLGNFS